MNYNFLMLKFLSSISLAATNLFYLFGVILAIFSAIANPVFLKLKKQNLCFTSIFVVLIIPIHLLYLSLLSPEFLFYCSPSSFTL